MPTHCEKKIVPYRSDQMFELVADIASYPKFLPWCVASRIRSRKGDVVLADLIIGFRMIRERFTSRVVLEPPKGVGAPAAIKVEYLDGPLKSLRNEWTFTPTGNGDACEVDFFVDFEFRSKMLQKVAALFFSEVVSRMVGAFEDQAQVLYGDLAEAEARTGQKARTIVIESTA
ncbi:MAG: type II toxin-antitoxin system RatA family toxin [Alphaproteobacteria bacterium]|nr:type II toxin-antitoxin system RatA family toxin [Alphaproteobacteria bacterium SS10]